MSAGCFIRPGVVIVLAPGGRAGNSLNGFLSKSLFFCKKMSEWAICSKKRVICSCAHFWWATWAIRSHCSPKKREWGNRSFFKLKTYKKISFIFFCQKCLSELLIYHERPKGFAHGCSFVMSDLRDSLTVAHLSWAIWANHSQLLIWFEQNERMSKWANERMSKFPALLCRDVITN